MDIKKFGDWLNEKHIGSVEDTVSIRVELDTTEHAEERKLRHGENNPITNEQIKRAVKDALDTIAENQLKGIDRIGRKYHIYDRNLNFLNVIGSLQRNNDDELVFKVITVMHKEGFIPSSDAKTITI